MLPRNAIFLLFHFPRAHEEAKAALTLTFFVRGGEKQLRAQQRYASFVLQNHSFCTWNLTHGKCFSFFGSCNIFKDVSSTYSSENPGTF